MGYYASSVDNDFLIQANQINPLMKAFREKYGDQEWSKECETVQKVFACFGLDIEIDDRGDIDYLWFEYGKYSSFDSAFFDVIAPYVSAGSYITFCGEENFCWAFYFDGKTCTEYAGETVFPGMPSMKGPHFYLNTNIGA